MRRKIKKKRNQQQLVHFNSLYVGHTCPVTVTLYFLLSYWFILGFYFSRPPTCHHSTQEKHYCHFGRCPPCRQPCQKTLTCGHLCPVSCHDQALVKQTGLVSRQWKMVDYLCSEEWSSVWPESSVLRLLEFRVNTQSSTEVWVLLSMIISGSSSFVDLSDFVIHNWIDREIIRFLLELY